MISEHRQDTSMDIFLRFRDEMGNVMENSPKVQIHLLCPYRTLKI